MIEQAAHRIAPPSTFTLRDALREHVAGPELVAALGSLADRGVPQGWVRWSAARREVYLDDALNEALTRRWLAGSAINASADVAPAE